MFSIFFKTELLVYVGNKWHFIQLGNLDLKTKSSTCPVIPVYFRVSFFYLMPWFFFKFPSEYQTWFSYTVGQDTLISGFSYFDNRHNSDFYLTFWQSLTTTAMKELRRDVTTFLQTTTLTQFLTTPKGTIFLTFVTSSQITWVIKITPCNLWNVFGDVTQDSFFNLSQNVTKIIWWDTYIQKYL